MESQINIVNTACKIAMDGMVFIVLVIKTSREISGHSGSLEP